MTLADRGHYADRRRRPSARYRYVLADATGLPVGIADQPLNCVAYGAGKALDYIGKWGYRVYGKPIR